jgi:uncharacterized protein YgiM (DUF1202 family)
MKKLLLATVMAVSTATAALACDGESCAVVLRMSDGYLNLRTGPTVQSNIVLRLYPGDRVSVDETVNGWSHISGVARLDRDDGKNPTQGWVSSKWIKQSECD